jgi:2-iminobutanoate/2-iminopropanoate deaminase
MRKVITTDQAPRPIGPYSQAVVDGDTIYVSGQGPVNPSTGALELGDAGAQTRRVLDNLKAILEAAGSSLDRVSRCNVYLRDIDDFAAMNEVYGSYFSAPYPARTTIQAGALPQGIGVEIDCIARR